MRGAILRGLWRASSARAGITQLVECKLPKLDVAGSSPVARSIYASNSQIPHPIQQAR